MKSSAYLCSQFYNAFVMKILLSNKFYYPRGGDCIHMIAQKKLLEEHGHKVAIFAMQHPDNLPNEYSAYWPSMLEYSSIRPGNIKETILRPLFSKEVKTKWNNLLDEFQPDIIHLHNIHTQLSPIIAEEAWKRSIPVFWTLHDYKLICPSYSFLRDGKICEKCIKDKISVIKYCCIKGSLFGSLIGYLEAKKWSNFKLEKYTISFISPSFFLKNKMEESGYLHTKITQLYNFASEEKFRAVNKKEDYYIYLGRLSKEKGLNTLLEAAKKKPQFKLKIIGDGPLRSILEKRYSADHIEFLGFKPWTEIEQILGKSKFLVIPSEWYENNPLSIIESLALGTPVLGANIGGIPELINNSNGQLFDPGNIDVLVSKIDEMMMNNNWDYLNISKMAKTKFESKLYYNSLMEIYNHKS